VLIEVVFDKTVDAAAARATAKAGTQFVNVAGRTGGDHFDVTVLRVADPTAQIELRGFALHEPAKTDALYTTLDEEMENHASQGQFCRCARGAQDGF